MMGEGFDHSLRFLAMEGDEIAGISLCRPKSYDDPEMGYVNILAVRRAWRKRGIGLALLQHSFANSTDAASQGWFGMDAETTGAVKLYENAGMHVHLAFDLFGKMVRRA